MSIQLNNITTEVSGLFVEFPNDTNVLLNIATFAYENTNYVPTSIYRLKQKYPQVCQTMLQTPKPDDGGFHVTFVDQGKAIINAHIVGPTLNYETLQFTLGLVQASFPDNTHPGFPQYRFAIPYYLDYNYRNLNWQNCLEQIQQSMPNRNITIIRNPNTRQ